VREKMLVTVKSICRRRRVLALSVSRAASRTAPWNGRTVNHCHMTCVARRPCVDVKRLSIVVAHIGRSLYIHCALSRIHTAHRTAPLPGAHYARYVCTRLLYFAESFICWCKTVTCVCTVGVAQADNYFPKSSFSSLPLQSFFSCIGVVRHFRNLRHLICIHEYKQTQSGTARLVAGRQCAV